MAQIEIGQTSISLPRRGESHWDFGSRSYDDAFSPHIILQKGIQCMYISFTSEEIAALLAWGSAVLEQEGS